MRKEEYVRMVAPVLLIGALPNQGKITDEQIAKAVDRAGRIFDLTEPPGEPELFEPPINPEALGEGPPVAPPVVA